MLQPQARKLNHPNGLAFDTSDNLYIADGSNNAIRKVTPGGIISTIAGTGVSGYSGDSGPATSAQLHGPSGIAVDPNGNVVFGDWVNHVVRMVTPGGIISTIAGNGTSGYSGDSGPATSAQFQSPSGVAYDGVGNLYVTDFGQHVVRKVTPGGTITTAVGLAGGGYSGDGGAATGARLNSPDGITFDTAGNMYISDYGNGVVRMVTSGGTITTVVGDGNYGTPATADQLRPHASAALLVLPSTVSATSTSATRTTTSSVRSHCSVLHSVK